MKIAIITLTFNGQILANTLSNELDKDPTVMQVDLYHKNVKQTLKEIFLEYDCILGIMASGIMVRNICELIRNKHEDPAVLVMDEKSKHVISLLSGHYGGGNDLTIKFAKLSGAEPVITTATDINNKIGVDALARQYYMYLNPFSNVLKINQALVDGKTVELALPSSFNYLAKDKTIKNTYKLTKSPDQILVRYKDFKITLTPRKLMVGIGARKDISTDSVLFALNEVSRYLKIPKERIDHLVTAEPKKQEKGIIEAAKKLKIPLKILNLKEIKDFNHPQLSESPLVKKTFGVSGVCEPVALISAGKNSHLIFKKTAYKQVTVAVALSE